MTAGDGSEIKSTPDVPPAPGADVTTGSEAATESDHADAPVDPPATTPRLEHLQETMDKAHKAADQALAPQHDDT